MYERPTGQKDFVEWEWLWPHDGRSRRGDNSVFNDRSRRPHGPASEVTGHMMIHLTRNIRPSHSVPSLHDDQTDSPLAQIIGVAVLEFGILLHSVLIGLTLAADPDFKILFIVIVFHQTFEGLGLGSHLAYMQLAPAYRDIPIWGALLYGITTPVGVAAGLGVRTTYSPDSTTASIVSGVMDALSADILIYTIMVELIAHEILLNREMRFVVSNWKLARSVMMLISGCGIMALLAKWA
ncbi:hypothetical protein D9757_005248 [Collybiopsis confluens]|uniref:Uncharacterized protein n=1 Tax=Collybiopsis confluens TaxID=2823264 RepID=A0A8H5HW95_9AGAR|nr:hypothetical protein D9757_005248 [Collybiopsis confluens]